MATPTSSSTACRTADRTSQRVTALEDRVTALERQLGTWVEFEAPLWSTGFAPFAAESPRTAVEPRALSPVDLGIGGTRRGFYIRIGQRLHVRYLFSWGEAPWFGGVGAIMTQLPLGLVATGGHQYFHAQLWTRSGTMGSLDWAGSALVQDNEPWMYWMFPRSTTDCRVSFYSIGGPQPGEQTWSVPHTPGGYPEGGLLACNGTLDVA